MSRPSARIRSVAVVGAGAAGAAAAAALSAEKYFDRIRVFERRETPGGTWIYDHDPGRAPIPTPGKLAPELDPGVSIPPMLPATTEPLTQERWDRTPVYAGLTTNVPDIAMSFSDCPFPYGPFTPHWIPKQNVQEYFSCNRTDECLALNTTVEDVMKIHNERWRLVMRRHDAFTETDSWWKEEFDAVVLANGHYAVPFIPFVPGLLKYMERFPRKVMHSKAYRTPGAFTGKRILVIGNSASGHDITTELVNSADLPVYQSRRSKSRWDGDDPPLGVAWKPVISRYCAETGSIDLADGTSFAADEVDCVIYCTGYQPSFPFWNERTNGGPLWNYQTGRLIGSYQHTFFRDYPTLSLIGMPRTLTFRSFEYQAIAVARILSGRNSASLPSRTSMEAWEQQRADACQREKRKFHEIAYDTEDGGEMMDYFRELYEIAGLPTLEGSGKSPPVLDEATRWALQNIKKYPEPARATLSVSRSIGYEGDADDWVVVHARGFQGLQILP